MVLLLMFSGVDLVV